MVNVGSSKCRTKGGGKVSSFGVAGTKMRGYCAQHAKVGMFNVGSSKCRTKCCGKVSSFGVAGTKMREYPYRYIGYGGLLADTVQRIWTNHVETCGGA